MITLQIGPFGNYLSKKNFFDDGLRPSLLRENFVEKFFMRFLHELRSVDSKNKIKIFDQKFFWVQSMDGPPAATSAVNISGTEIFLDMRFSRGAQN